MIDKGRDSPEVRAHQARMDADRAGGVPLDVPAPEPAEHCAVPGCSEPLGRPRSVTRGALRRLCRHHRASGAYAIKMGRTTLARVVAYLSEGPHPTGGNREDPSVPCDLPGCTEPAGEVRATTRREVEKLCRGHRKLVGDRARLRQTTLATELRKLRAELAPTRPPGRPRKVPEVTAEARGAEPGVSLRELQRTIRDAVRMEVREALREILQTLAGALR